MKVRRKLAKWASAAAIAYMFDPTSGAERRARLVGFCRTATRRWTSQPPPSDPVAVADLRQAFRWKGIPLTDHTLTEAGDISCGSCGQASAPQSVKRQWRHRLEGASDPSEMLTVSGIQCKHCNSVGLLVLPFGPNADEREAEALQNLPAPGTERYEDVLDAVGFSGRVLGAIGEAQRRLGDKSLTRRGV